ncbi:glutamate receptor ionotropic, kainate 2-like [Contarinia nasturtii]|uniref:glutamate receptor ionotropic, kainate 2-like n=1 Tax=Contarinia nasturtii TaxID=265458 RepID=UPI0012D454B3|nr:glutamate receptor ionotropic, kainate 2-like [Contarinia nasturtii]
MKFDYRILLFIVIVNVSNSKCQKNQVTIGAVFEDNGFFDKNIQMLKYAVNEANEKILQDSGMELIVKYKKIAPGREWHVSKRVCDLLERGVGVIFGPQSVSSAYHAMNICDSKEIPYVNTYMDEDAAAKSAALNIHPNLESLTQLLLDFVIASEWKNVTILYESPLWLKRVAKVLETNKDLKNRINVRNLDYTTNNEFRPVLQKARELESTNIILECSSESLPIILRQSMQVGLITKQYNWIITNLDTHSINLEPYQYSDAKITTFRILNKKHPIFDTPKDDDDSNQDLFNVDPESKFDVETSSTNNNCKSNFDSTNVVIPNYPDKLNGLVSLQTSLIYDAVMVFSIAIEKLGADQVAPVPIACFNRTSMWNKGYTILNYMKNVNYDGVSGRIEFDNSGVRSNITIDLLDVRSETIGQWTYGVENRLKIGGQNAPLKKDDIYGSLKNVTLRVITALTEPYTMYKNGTDLLIGDDQFEGYAIDLIFELSLILGFNYTFIVEFDNNYGTRDEATGDWNGMIGKLISGDADLAITDLTVTAARVHAIDFSPSIMNLGIAILYQIPKKAPPDVFSFMKPLGGDVWILLGTTYLFVSICFFCVGRISPAQWECPYPCIEEPKFLENQLSFQNSLWFAAGAILQQGSEIEIKAVSVRLLSAAWWFFTLVIVASYTANLAAFLVLENPIEKIKSVEDFANCGLENEKECPAATFGVKEEGATKQYFEHSEHEPFKHMYRWMEKNRDVAFVKNNQAGLEKVQNSDYAFLMESTSLLYFTERNCDVTMAGDLIDDRNYAIGMPKNYKYYHELCEGVLRLQELDVLEKLHRKWWKSKRGGGACQKKSSTEAEPLELNHVVGVFVVVAGGVAFALLCGIVGMSYGIRKRAKKANIEFKEQMKIELRFLMKSLANPDKPKPTRLMKKGQLSSSRSDTTSRSNHTISP